MSAQASAPAAVASDEVLRRDLAAAHWMTVRYGMDELNWVRRYRRLICADPSESPRHHHTPAPTPSPKLTLGPLRRTTSLRAPRTGAS